MLMVGLTGGIGSGKSAVAQRLARLGAVIIDSDVLAREVVAAGTDGFAEVVAAFGDRVVGPGGELDRPALGKQVFGDEAARRRLEGIIHPRVRARAAHLAQAAPADAVVVNDVPLLVETGQAASYHLVLVVQADFATRIRRLAETRGMSRAQAEGRIAAQATDDERAAAADVLLDNNAGLAELDQRVEAVWRDRLVPFEKNLRHGTVPARPRSTITPYRPEWPVIADRLAARIRRAAGPQVVVDHIGPTAVPGLAARDVIDLMLTVRSPDEADALAEPLSRAGFPRRPAKWSGSVHAGSEWLHGNADPARAVDLRVRVEGSPGWRSSLLLRDHLQADTVARNAYADASSSDVGAESSHDAEVRAAEKWAEATGWQPRANQGRAG